MPLLPLGLRSVGTSSHAPDGWAILAVAVEPTIQAYLKGLLKLAFPALACPLTQVQEKGVLQQSQRLAPPHAQQIFGPG